jgi:lysophospholipase L1-like esterase
MKRWFYLSISVNVFLIVLFYAFVQRLGGLNYLINKIEEPATAVYQNRTNQFALLNVSEGNILFVGSSLTQYGNWNELFNSKCLNRGIGGDDSYGVLNRVEDLIRNKPSKIFIMIGINDLGRGASIDQILSNYREIIKKVKDGSPKTKIYIQSVLPVNNTIRDQHRKNSDILLLDAQIEKLSNETGLTYINLYPLFTDSKGEMDLKLSADGIHINGAGYLIWKKAIQNYVND